MTKKSSSKTTKKYPDIVYQNKALCKAVSLLPVYSKSNLPVAYIKSLPMVIGAITVLVLLILPSTGNKIISFSKNVYSDFAYKTEVLKSEFVFSLRSGVTAYVNQIEKNVNILPIDTKVEPRVYLGRSEVEYLTKVKTKSLSENAHLLSASISQSLGYFK